MSPTPPPVEIAPPKGDSPCPCGGGKTFGYCCDAVLKGRRAAANAEELMRSRFSAHVVRDFAYLHRTHLVSSKEPYVPDAKASGEAWTRLVIHAHEPGAKAERSFVDFTAYYREGDLERAFHEKAEFERIDGTWFYLQAVREGPAPIRSAQAKVGRNSPCPCGSGKKYKQCCGR